MTVKFFESINLPRCKNDLFYFLMQVVADCLTRENLLNGQFQAQQTAFLRDFEQFDSSMQVSRKSMLTPRLQELDEQRIQEWRVVANAARGLMKMADRSTSAAADFVTSLIKNHGDLYNMKAFERSGALVNLCQDLTEKYAAQVQTLGLTAFAAQLSATNAEYESLYDQRLHQWSEFVEKEAIDARRATEDSFENLCIMVASGIISAGLPTYSRFVDYVNEAIKRIKTSMRHTSAATPARQ